MGDALGFFRTYEIGIYILLGIVAVFYLRKFSLAWQELRGAAFGLERESAQSRLNQAASGLIFILALMMSEFILVSFVIPNSSENSPLPTPTLNLLSTPTTTLEANLDNAAQVNNAAITPTSPTPLEETATNNCVPGQIEISAPQDGSQVNGIIEVVGSANIPNFGFYKLEMRQPGDENWLTILAGNEIKQGSVLGSWNTTLINPGDYQLRLVLVDNAGQASAPCMVQVHVVASVETPQP
ncbi:MAG: hypothetical protein ACPL3P_08390 [Anaerolineales bacterium]